MFDPRTAEFLRKAPSLPGLEAQTLPQALTRQYARLVSLRLRGDDTHATSKDIWPVDRIADTYEIIASLAEDSESKRAAAFVAGTAQQIISRRLPEQGAVIPAPIDRDGVAASISAALLFLAAEQYADANEAAGPIESRKDDSTEVRELAQHIRDFAKGNLGAILERKAGKVRLTRAKLSRPTAWRALRAMLSALSRGVEHLATFVLARGGDPLTELQLARELFRTVLTVSTKQHDLDTGFSTELGTEFGKGSIPLSLTTQYPGPAHLASLLLSASHGIEEAPLTQIPPPSGADPEFWRRWLTFRADHVPFVWRNHRTALKKGFHQTGTSAVLVLPTGAGKTTISVLKIAGVLARGKKVVFLAPTHALVEQLTDDLEALFPPDRFPLQVSGDSDSILLDDEQLKDIEVMTPERCLAMLSYSPDAFANVGLLVFDECHLLSPNSRKIGRALDSMLCLLAFQAAAPDADLLLLSAMLKNGKELAKWVEELTGRPCAFVDLLWKPSRQARGVLVYRKADLDSIRAAAIAEQKRIDEERKVASASLRARAADKLVARPYVLWGLQHNWRQAERSHAFSHVTDGPLPLAGSINQYGLNITPNANKIAAAIARTASATGLKTIVFVNKKADAVRTAADIAESIGPLPLTPDETKLLEAIALELGGERHSIFGETSFAAVPHHAAMLRLERKLSEILFRRVGGAKVIVATPTLAQGLNLPAEIAILAGDQRSTAEGKRESLEAHELLNAAARAGRAGHLANGVVILIPEPIIPFTSTSTLTSALQNVLQSVVPEDDRCLTVSDALEVVLDRVTLGDMHDRDVRYTVNRLAALTAADGSEIKTNNLLLRSLAAFRARRDGEEAAYVMRVRVLWDAALAKIETGPDRAVVLIASQSGIGLEVLDRLRLRLLANTGNLPNSIPAWVDWTLDWLKADTGARDDLLGDTKSSINAAVGHRSTDDLNDNAVETLRPAVRAWLEGKPLVELERILGGDPDSSRPALCVLPRARELIATVIPRGLSFIVSLVGRMVQELDMAGEQEDLNMNVVQSLAPAVRRGFDDTGKLEFANSNRDLSSRVQVHMAYAKMIDSLASDFDDLFT